jgi:hypothetical protein
MVKHASKEELNELWDGMTEKDNARYVFRRDVEWKDRNDKEKKAIRDYKGVLAKRKKCGEMTEEERKARNAKAKARRDAAGPKTGDELIKHREYMNEASKRSQQAKRDREKEEQWRNENERKARESLEEKKEQQKEALQNEQIKADKARSYRTSWAREDRKKHPEKYRAIDKKKYEGIMNDPEKLEKERERQRKKEERRRREAKMSPEEREAARELERQRHIERRAMVREEVEDCRKRIEEKAYPSCEKHRVCLCIKCHFFCSMKGSQYCSECLNSRRAEENQVSIEKEILEYLTSNGYRPSLMNSPGPCDTARTRKRPDMVYYDESMPYTIIIEVDEHSHKSYDSQCEIVRMDEIREQLRGEFDTNAKGYFRDKPLYYIRYSPIFKINQPKRVVSDKGEEILYIRNYDKIYSENLVTANGFVMEQSKKELLLTLQAAIHLSPPLNDEVKVGYDKDYVGYSKDEISRLDEAEKKLRFPESGGDGVVKGLYAHRASRYLASKMIVTYPDRVVRQSSTTSGGSFFENDRPAEEKQRLQQKQKNARRAFQQLINEGKKIDDHQRTTEGKGDVVEEANERGTKRKYQSSKGLTEEELKEKKRQQWRQAWRRKRAKTTQTTLGPKNSE